MKAGTKLKGDKKLAQRAQKLANQQMRIEVLPLLSRQHPRPNSWNPLRADLNGPSPYGMKLWLPDKLAMEILGRRDLMDMTQQIVLDATMTAALDDPLSLLTPIFSALMSDERNP